MAEEKKAASSVESVLASGGAGVPGQGATLVESLPIPPVQSNEEIKSHLDGERDKTEKPPVDMKKPEEIHLSMPQEQLNGKTSGLIR